jgi:hypothetical protein
MYRKRLATTLALVPGVISRGAALRGLTKNELADRVSMSAATLTAADQGEPVSARAAYRLATFFEQNPVVPAFAGLLAQESRRDGGEAA